MKAKLIKVVSLLFAGAVALGYFMSACKVEHVGPKDPLDMPLSEILSELTQTKTQAEAETAIHHLVAKTGVGTPVKGSKYGDYLLPDDFIPGLAKSHLRFLNDTDDYYAMKLGEVFEIEQMLFTDEESVSAELEKITGRLHEQASAALSDPEAPNNAVLLAIAADGAHIPAVIPLYDENKLMPPVQDFLFTAWLNSEFQSAESFQLERSNQTRFPVIFRFMTRTVECVGNRVKLLCPTHTREAACMEQLECLMIRRRQYLDDVRDCFRGWHRTGDCAAAKACADALLDPFLADMDACLEITCPHDQGGN